MQMIQEEFNYNDMSEYLKKTNDLLIAGFPGTDERSCYFVDEWTKEAKDILLFKMVSESTIQYKFISSGNEKDGYINMNIEVADLLKKCEIIEKNILLDMSGLEHVLIMFLTKILITMVKPKTFLASYIRPEKYIYDDDSIGFMLSEQVSAVKSVPGFIRRESADEVLCAFLGFEGIRVKSVLDLLNNIKRFIPVVAFPSGTSQWFNVTMWNCMDIIQSGNYEYDTRKCYSESIYDAIELLMNNISQDEHVVLAPLGTRPHSMASAIFACQHKHARIIYDYVIERQRRTSGIAHIQIYNITPFIKI